MQIHLEVEMRPSGSQPYFLMICVQLPQGISLCNQATEGTRAPSWLKALINFNYHMEMFTVCLPSCILNAQGTQHFATAWSSTCFFWLWQHQTPLSISQWIATYAVVCISHLAELHSHSPCSVRCEGGATRFRLFFWEPLGSYWKGIGAGPWGGGRMDCLCFIFSWFTLWKKQQQW